jgi:hypothetical protein
VLESLRSSYPCKIEKQELIRRPEEPTPALVRQYVRSFDAGSAGLADRALTELFGAFPENRLYEHVLLKVVALNSLYNTYILNLAPVADHIWRHNIDPKLAQGAPELVNEIALTPHKDGKIRRNYSFATKYCAWHNPDAYPIFDSYVEKLIWEYQRFDKFSDFRRGDLTNNYPTYKYTLEAFRQRYRLMDFSFKDLDKFLWGYGKAYFTNAS